MYGIGQYRSVFAGGLDADQAQAQTFLREACEKAAALAAELTGAAR